MGTVVEHNSYHVGTDGKATNKSSLGTNGLLCRKGEAGRRRGKARGKDDMEGQYYLLEA